jgi:hypothetical protein
MNPLHTLFCAVLISLLPACESDHGGGQLVIAEDPPEDRGPDPFQFARTPLADYVQVDRMGQPVVATVLLKTVDKDHFNEGDPQDDGDFAGKMITQLDKIHFELDDDFAALGFTLCELDVCARQVVFRIVPDVLHLVLAEPDGFPNGRRFQDSVVDRILALALLDLTTPSAQCGNAACTVDSFVELPLNPTANESAFGATFPYLAAPHPQP